MKIKILTQRIGLLGLLTVLFSGLVSISNAQKFTLPVFPDTQTEVTGRHDMYYSRFDWLIKNKDSLNIPMVLHVGDVVNFDNYGHWEVASIGFDKLDHVPIIVAIRAGVNRS